MAWQDAIQERGGGCLLLLEVTPGAREAAFPAGFNPWRGRIGIRVTAPTQDGKANQAVLAAVAAFLGLAAGSVQLVQGESDRRKMVHVPLPVSHVRQALQAAMASRAG